MSKTESIIGCVSYLIVLALCTIAFSRRKHPGWLILGLWSLCTLLAFVATALIEWGAFSTIGVSPTQQFLQNFIVYDALPCDVLPVIAIGFLVFWRSPQVQHTAPA